MAKRVSIRDNLKFPEPLFGFLPKNSSFLAREQSTTKRTKTEATSTASFLTDRLHSIRLDRQPRNVYQKPLDVIDDFILPAFEHNPDDVKILKDTLDSSFIFSALKRDARKQLVDAFEPCQFKAGELIIKQGDEGDYLFVLKEGKVRFTINGTTIASSSETGCLFGELALLYSCPRAASVIAENDTNYLFRLDQKTFRYLLSSITTKSTDDKKNRLKGIPFCKDLSASAFAKLAHKMTPLLFDANEAIVKKGEEGDRFYVVHEGTLLVKDISVGDVKYDNITLGPGDYFGERALATNEPRSANVVSTSKGVAFTIDKITFEKVLGKMSKLVLKAQDSRILSAVPLIKKANLNADQIDAIASHVVDTTFKAGEVIMKEGGFTNKAGIFLVRNNGEIHIKSKDRDEIITAGRCFGECALLQAARSNKLYSKSPYTVTALKETVCGVLRYRDFIHIIGSIDVNEGHDESSGKEQRESSDELAAENGTKLPGFDIELEDLKKHAILGEGTFGQVWLVTAAKQKHSSAYALKIQSKYDLIREGQAEAAVREKQIMEKIRHPFIIKMLNSYQDADFVYALLELVQGGELFSVIHERGVDCLREVDAQFYAHAIVDALVYMHRGRYVYRDLKPENVMIDSKGYPILVDLGFAKHVPEQTFTLCGTPSYLSPECIIQRGYDMCIDHWAIGILIYEMITGRSPFSSPDMTQMEIFGSIVEDDFDPPVGSSTEVQDLISKLLVKDPTYRLGSLARGADEILEHPWFSDFDVIDMRKKQIPAPWVPQLGDPLDISCFNDWSDLKDKTKQNLPKIHAKHELIFKEY